MNEGTESQFEETTIERLRALGYRYQYGWEIESNSREESRTLAALPDTLLPKLLSDELRVKDAEKAAGAKL